MESAASPGEMYFAFFSEFLETFGEFSDWSHMKTFKISWIKRSLQVWIAETPEAKGKFKKCT